MFTFTYSKLRGLRSYDKTEAEHEGDRTQHADVKETNVYPFIQLLGS